MGTAHHHKAHWGFAILELYHMPQDRKTRIFIIVAETRYRSYMLFHHSGHFLLAGHCHRLFKQHLNKIGATGLPFFIVLVLLEYFAHL